MRRDLGVVVTTLVVLGLLGSFCVAGTADAQMGSAIYVGKFTLKSPVLWGDCDLQPGTYTMTIRSTGQPTVALIRDSEGRAVTHVMSGARSGKANGVNALLLRERDGQLRVHSLVLTDLKMVLIYDPSLAQENAKETREARAGQTVPVVWAKQ